MTSELDLEQLEKVAQEATDGPWKLLGGGEYVTPIGVMVAPDDGGVSPEDAVYIATFDPPTALALVARLREAEAKVERVEAIHRPMRVVLYPGAGERVMEVCAECRTRSGDWHPRPCPTIRALEEEA